MLVTRTSFLTNITRTLDLPITEEQLAKYNSGVVIQEAMSNLTPNQREFFKTGLVEEEWDSIFNNET